MLVEHPLKDKAAEMALDGPIDTKIKAYLKNALQEDLDDLLSQYMNAYVLQQRIVLATNQFEKNANILPETKSLLRDLVTAAEQYLDNFNKQLLVDAIEKALTGLNAKQGYVFNLTQTSKACSEIAQLLIPIKEELLHRVKIDSLIDSFVLLEKSSLSASMLAPPPPPPPSPLSLAVRPKVMAPPLKPSATALPVKVALDREFNQELLLKKLKVIKKELTQDQPTTEPLEGPPKLTLMIKRELATVALEAERRRELKRLADTRSDPSSALQAPKSKGLLFLAMIQSEVSLRNEKSLKARAMKQQIAVPSGRNESLPIEEELGRLQISNKPCG